MGFEDLFRLSVHAVIGDERGILLLRASYGHREWGLPGGALEPGETVHEALFRECREELGCDMRLGHLTGIYHHAAVNSHAILFRCELAQNASICLSDEHIEWRYMPLNELGEVQRLRVRDALEFSGHVRSRRF